MTSSGKEIGVGLVGIVTSIYLWCCFIPRTVIVRGEVHYFFRDPQFTPKLWTALIFISSLGILYHAVKQKKAEKSRETIKVESGGSLRLARENIRILVLLIIMYGFMILMPKVDYRIVTGIGLAATLLCFGYRKPAQVFGISLATSLVMHFFFSNILRIRL
ncbi:Tripartite tricarboxylate transporter TctB family protein [Tindallia magadiensis]|uniref:Tripartite tricarboxylate transporter TctB family protein n=1 Tax=Tindallia magadiensis TaxID=69895 RepID=A0A1I3EL35_9FIRM|nr:tripartite tricarboxylate transporter TctB family protein [Tindallia magadiensis]SFH99588.1 Tripartite tricarboxylate transporter TctB family protein [Tindallia magadiensis]